LAATLQASRLTEAHRLAQLRLGVVTVARMRTIWRLLNPEALDATYPEWLAAAYPIVQAQRSTSARLAANFLTAFKTLELGTAARLAPVLSETADREAVATSLLVTGPLSVKRAMARGIQVAKAMPVAEAASSAAAMRHALDGGRQTINQTLRADPDAQGWVRVASGSACQFCTRLDGKRHPTDDADFPAHDGCSCSQEPVYR
jgi:hypothetical protein